MEAKYTARPRRVLRRVGVVGLALSFALPATLAVASVLIRLGVLSNTPWSPQEPAGSFLYWVSFSAPAGLLFSAVGLFGRPKKTAGLGLVLAFVGSAYWIGLVREL